MKAPQGLRELRERRLLSINELSKRTGVAHETITRLESGEGSPQPRTLRKLADGLGVGYEELYEEPAVPKARAPHSAGRAEQAGAVEESEPDALAGTIRRLSAWGKEAAGSGARSADLQRNLELMDDVFEEAFHAYRTREARGEEAGGLARSLEELVVASVAVKEALKEAAREEADPGKKAQIADFIEHRDRRGTARTLGLRQAEAG